MATVKVKKRIIQNIVNSVSVKDSIPSLPERVKRVLAKPLPVISGEESYYWLLSRDGITQSAISVYEECPRKLQYKLREGLTKGTSDHSLDFGNMFHHILDKCYSSIKTFPVRKGINPKTAWTTIINQACKEYYYKQSKDLDVKDTQKFELMFGTCKLMLEHYFDWWGKEDLSLNFVGVEQLFDVPYTLRNGVKIRLRGKIDGILKIDGGYWILENKTKGSIDDIGAYSVNGVVESMGYNLQVLFYCLAIKGVYGVYPKGVIYNLIKRPGQEFKGTFNRKPETLPEYYERIKKDIAEKIVEVGGKKFNPYLLRYHVRITEEEIQTWSLQDFDSVIEEIYQWDMQNLISRRVQASCFMFRKPCEFLDICSSGSKVGYSKREHVFPELVSEEEDE